MLSHKSRQLLLLALFSALIVASTGSKSSKLTSGRSSVPVAADTASKAAPTASSGDSTPTSSSSVAPSSSSASVGIATMLSSLGSLTARVPTMLSSAVPVVLMMGLGALLVPVLGLDSLLRVVKRREMPTIPSNFLPYINTVQDILQKVTHGLENMEKRYGH